MQRLSGYLAVILLVFSLGALAQATQPTASTSSVLTNAGVISMVKAGLDEAVIVAKIRHSPVSFDVSTTGLIELKNSGVPSSIVTVMLERPEGAPSVVPPQQEPAPTPAPPGRDVDGRALMAKVVDALGGEKIVGTVKGVRTKDKRETKTPYGAASLDVEITMVFPDRMYMKTESVSANDPKKQVMTSIMALKPGAAYFSINGTIKDMSPQAREEMEKALRFAIIPMAQHARDPKYTFEVLGSEKINGANTTALEVTNDGYSARWYIDPTSGKVIRISRMTMGFNGAPVPTTFDYSDWRTVDGLTFPFKIVETGAISSVIQTKSLEINPAVQSVMFERPEGGQIHPKEEEPPVVPTQQSVGKIAAEKPPGNAQEDIPVEKWQGKQFAFGPTIAGCRPSGLDCEYMNFARSKEALEQIVPGSLPYDKYAGKTMQVISVEPAPKREFEIPGSSSEFLVTFRLAGSGEIVYGLTYLEDTLCELIGIDDLNKAKERWTGKLIYPRPTDPFGKNIGLSAFDAKTGETKQIEIAPWEPLRVLQVMPAQSCGRGSIWIVAERQNGDQGFIATNYSWTNQSPSLWMDARPWQFYFSESDPRQDYKLPQDIWNLIQAREVRQGMTEKQVRLSWGDPDKINTGIYEDSTQEQWVYKKGQYLYFRNGILTAIQSSE